MGRRIWHERIYLVQAAGIPVEQHFHALLKDLLCICLSQLIFASFYGLSEQRQSDVGTVARGDG